MPQAHWPAAVVITGISHDRYVLYRHLAITNLYRARFAAYDDGAAFSGQFISLGKCPYCLGLVRAVIGIVSRVCIQKRCCLCFCRL